jgi:hypothetical protein
VKVIAALAAAALFAGTAQAAEPPALSVDTSVSPPVALFGDPVDVAVQVLVDDDHVDPATVRLEADAAPLARIGGVERDSWRSGGLAYERFRFRAACADEGCLAGDALLRVRPQPMRVSGRGRDGRDVAVRVQWPRLEMGRRVTAAALTATPAFAVEDRPRAVSWRTAPGRLWWVLAIVAVALLASAVALVAAEARGARRRRRVTAVDALAAALAELRAARDEPARRRAAGRVSRILDRSDGRVAPEAARLAWSEEPPAPEAARELAERVEREVAP